MRQSNIRSLIIAVVVAGATCVALPATSVTTLAGTKPDATIELKGGSVAAGVGVSWGSGTLIYKGKAYPIKVTGFDVGDVGITNVTATGKVYDLKKLDDFEGNYSGVGTAASLGGGAGAVTMQNHKGVTIDVFSTTQGINLALAASGARMDITTR